MVAEPTSARSRVARGAALLVLTGVMASTVGAFTAAPAEAATGSAAGRVFRDYNSNGVFDTATSATSPAVDTGIAGVAVRAYDASNTVVGNATTAANGTYSISYNTSTTSTNVRLEFDTPTGMVPSRAGVSGATNDTDVQFVSTGVTNADYALSFPQDYAPANPVVAFARQVGAIKLDGSAQNTDAGSLFTNSYNTRGTTATTAATKEATITQTGSIWGVATLDESYLFSSAYFKRHAAVGPGGLGAVYLTAAGGATDASVFATVGSVGTNPRPAMTTQAYFNDTTAYASVGKIGLGGMTMAPDHSALYVVNLAAKTLVRIPITINSSGVPVAGTQTSVAIPSPSCTGTARPFGVSSANGSLWVTQTCAATAVANQRGYVYKYDYTTNTFNTTPVVDIPLTGTANRGNAYSGGGQTATWRAWNDSTGTDVWPTTARTISYPQPLVSDVQFDANGDMTIGIKDRFGDQAGFAGTPANTTNTGVYEAMAAGDTLRACFTSPSTYTLESNGSCGSRTGSGVGNNEGPGGGEFYSDEFNDNSHDQVSLGGLLQVPGFPTILSTTFDPKSPGGDTEYGSQGYRFWSNTNGAFDVNTGWRQVGTAVRDTTTLGRESNFGKAGGMGDLDLLVKVPVEIGNRVWIDTDRDGIQEPGEPAVSGIQVSLLNSAGTVVGTTTTSSTGEYYFNDANVSGGLVAGAAYKIRLQRASDFASGGALADYALTTTGAGSKDKIDSDATVVSSYPEIALTAPSFGADHSYDVGFVRKAVSVGDFVWNDVDRDGVQDSAEPGISGVTVTITGPGGAAVTDVFGNAVTSTTTNASGAYTFANLPALASGQSYTVAINNNQAALVNAGYTPTVTGAGTAATDSSNGTATSGSLTTNGASDTTLDFGFVKKAVSVGDFVWVDSNRDGIQSSGEPGIAGVVVTITKADGSAVTNVNGATVTQTTTDANGKYSFDLLPAGVAYKVSVNNGQAALSGYTPTITGAGTATTDSSNGSATSAVLANNGDQDLSLDFGFVKPSVSVGDYVWADTNRNGVQDSGENGISGVTLTITRTDGGTVRNTVGTTVTSTTTNAAGAYTFANLEALPSGVFYRVSVDNTQAALAGAGFVPTVTGAGTAATDSSNGSATSGALTTNGASDTTLDFGFVKKAVSVGDFVWVDTNKNGVQDAGELGIPGVVVTITKADGTAVTDINGNAVTQTTTDANGKYTFALLPTGVAYKVSVNNGQAALADYTPTLTGAGTTATDSSNGSATSAVLANNGDADTTLDFGFRRKTVSVGDFVWVDTDRDGIQDSGEPGINGVTVTITRTDGNPVKKDNGTTVTSTTTNTTGAYSFSDLEALPSGVFYKVSIDILQSALSGYVPTQANQGGDTSKDSSTGSATSGALTNDGASDLTLDFGFVKPAVSVGDFLWFDANGNGIQDSGEAGIPGVTVTITKADGTAVTNVNGVAVTSTTTDANGKYTFDLLPAGVAYKVSVDNGQTALFPYVPTVTGQGTAATDSSNGSATSAVLTGNGASDTTLDFGFVKKKVSVGDFVWVDTNRDGLQTAGEPGISGVTVTIARTDGGTVRNVSGAAVTSTTTDANGKYTFANLEALPAGVRYRTLVDNTQSALTAYVPTLDGVGTDRAIDSSTSTSDSGNLTTDGASDLTLDFGFVKPAVSVGDFVWFDANGNGIQDSGEAGIPGVTVTITKADGTAVTNVNGTAVTSVTTDANGKYTFALLPSGVAYKVSVDNGQAALFAYTPTLTGQGTAATDSSNGSATTGVLTGNGASDLTLDFGFKKKAVSVGDFVWVDTNRDGLQTAGEPGISGVTVTITRSDSGTVRNVSGATVTSITTDANGKYLFANLEPLPAGTYYVTAVNNAQTALAPYVPTLSGVGNDRAVDSSSNTSVSGNLTTDGASDLTLDFGFVKPAVTVGDFIWSDTNGNGVQDAGEPGISGVTVTIKKADGTAVTDVNGNPVTSTTTDANGKYTFPLLPAGVAYTVSVDATQAALFPYAATLAGQGGDTTKDSSTGSATSAVVTANGGSDLSLDFGFVKKKVSVGDFVWVDSDRDGIQDAGEPGISGVTVTITRTDGATVKTVAGATVTSTTTDGFGKYLFANLEPLPASTHYVTAVNNGQSALAAYIPTIAGAGTDRAVDSSTSTSESGNLTTDGASDLTLDFGFVKPAVKVGDTVFVDTNGNGTQNAGEPGLAGVVVTIVGPGGAAVTDVNGNPVGPQTTDSNGSYLFPLLPALPAGQSYTVKVDPTQAVLAGYTPTNTPSTTGPLTTDGASDLTLDFGFRKKAVSVGDFVWVDTNRNGIQNTGEPGIPNVVVLISRSDNATVKTTAGATVTSATTNANGAYLFSNLESLPTGVFYKVAVDGTQAALSGYVPTLSGQGGDTSKDSSTATATSGALTTDGASDLTLDFGFVKPAVKVGDFVWADTNNNGIQDAGEPGIAGVTVRITYADGTAVTDVNGNPVTTVVTDANGAYTFDLLPSGKAYKVTVDNDQAALNSYAPTQTGQGTAATDSSNGSYTTGVLTGNGASDLTADFGFKAAAALIKLDKSASALNDLDGNGPDVGDTITYSFVVTNEGNRVLTDIQVNDPLFGGTSPNVTCGTGSLAVGASRTCTPRTYTLTQADVNNGSVVNSATARGTSPAGTVVTSSDTTTTSTTAQSVSVGDFVWVDSNRDGLQTSGEPGIQGVKLTIVGPTGNAVTDVNGNPVGEATTNANGKYSFINLPILPAGQHYTVKVDNTQTALAPYVATLAGVGTNRAVDSSTSTSESGNLTTDGASDLTLDFGFVKPAVTVGDFVWVDTNGNGVQDAGEPGISGVTVTIKKADGTAVTDVNGNPVTSTLTDGNGKYTFPLLPAGVAYTVSVDNTQAALAAYVPTLTGQGTAATDSSNGSYTTPVLTGNGASDLTADFGFKAAAAAVKLDKTASSINDLDGNGPDAGDTITYSFVVTNTGNVVLNPVQVNDPLFTGTAPNISCGTGSLAVGASRTCTPRTYTLTQADVNAGTRANTATVQGTAPNGAVVSANGSTTTPIVPVKVSVGDFVWVDSNRNGIQNSGEPGISGVTVTITRTDGAPVVNAAGTTVTSTTTNASGKYLFADLQPLPAGTSYVTAVDNTQTALAAYVPTLAGVGTDRAVDSSTSTATSGNLTTNGASDLTLDFGFVKPAVTVGDFVWVDTNGNGVQDAGEPGISGVTVTIKKADGTAVTDVNGNPVTSTLTDGNGKYTFPLLPAGVAYTVSVDGTQAALAAYTPTAANQGGNTALDSSTGSYTTPVLTGNGTTDLTADFGFKAVAPAITLDKSASSITDVDGNGPDAGDTISYSFVVTNSGNVALNPVTVNDPLFGGANPNITCGTGSLAVGASRTCTPRTYTLTQADVNSGSVLNTATAKGTAPNGTVVSDDDSTTTPVNVQSVSVGDFVWVDTDRDGIQDAGETGISGVKLTIVGPTGNAVTDVNGNTVGAATTNGAGQYVFANLPVLPAGQHYTVKLDNTQAALAAYVPTLAGQGTDTSKDSSTSSAESGNLTVNGTSDLTLDFGFVKPAVKVGDTVFVDTNGNGTQNAGEPGLAGVTVTIVGPGGAAVTDVNGNPVGPQTTDSNGNYLFPLLPALPSGQSYTVKVDPNQPALAGYTATNNPGATGPLTTNGASDLTVDFGFKKNTGTIGDFVWVDTNRNGVQNTGEPGIPGVTVTITKANGDPVVDTLGNPVGPQVTDANGAYLFTNLPVGVAYKVSIDNTQAALNGYVPTQTGQGTTATDSSTGSATSVVLTGTGASATDRTLDFGFVKPAVTVGDYVFTDTNGNGIQDAGDTGLPGVVLTIVGPNGNQVTDVYGNPVGPVTSGGNGQYTFTNLPALPAGQSYTVKVDNTQPALAGYTPAPTGQGTPATDSSNGSGQTGNLTTNGASDTTVDFGFVPNPLGPGKANVKITKTVDKTAPAVGDTVTYTLKVENTGDADANNVVVSDTLPTEVTFVSADAPCTQSNGVVSCNLGTLAPGQVRTVKIKATVDNVPAGTTQERHQIDVQKQEVVLDVEVGQTASTTVSCQPGSTVLDGSARVVSSGANVAVLENRATSLDTWKVTLKNLGTERAQNKAFIVCAKNETETVNNHSHQLQVSAAATTQTVALTSGRSNVTLSCATGSTPVQPGWVFDGAARVVTSYPLGTSSWVFGVDNPVTGGADNGTFAIRCLNNQTSTVAGHSHDLELAGLFRTVTVPAGQTVDVNLDCADSAIGNQGPKGIVAGYNLANGLTATGAATGVVTKGNEPQPVRRVFTLSNPTGDSLTADLYLLCMGTRTAGHDGSGDVVNTATVSTTSPEKTTNDNSSSATFRVTGTVTPESPKTNLKVSKSVSDATPRVGDTITYTLKAFNDSDVAAENVVLTDPLPTGVTFVSASSPGTLSGSTVVYDLGTVAAGATKTVTVTVKVGSAPASGTAHDHVIDVQKVEQSVALTAGQTKSVTVDCASGYVVTDGSGRVDQIDQGTGTPDAVRIIQSAAADEDSWTATFVNTATGNAQGKVFAVCTKKTTDEADGHTHALVVGDPVTATKPLANGTTTVDLSCAAGTSPIAPSYSVPATAVVRQSKPSGATGWTFVVDATATVSGDFSVRCLDEKVATADGHQHELSLTPISQTLTVAAGQTVEVTNSCGDAKGIVAGYAMEKGLVSLGNDPRPVVRVYRFYNPTGTAKEVTVHTLCLRTKTTANNGSGTVLNTAYGTTSTPETTTGDNAASVSFKVDTTPLATPAGTTVVVAPRTAYVTTTVKCAAGSKACTGSAVLVAAKTQKVNGKTIKKGAILAKATYQVVSGKTVSVKMKPTALGKTALASRTVKTAQVKVGKSVRTVTIRR